MEGQSTEQYASQLVQLLQQSTKSTESLARMPLVESLKQQADGLSSSADPHSATIWQLTGTSRKHNCTNSRPDPATASLFVLERQCMVLAVILRDSSYYLLEYSLLQPGLFVQGLLDTDMSHDYDSGKTALCCRSFTGGASNAAVHTAVRFWKGTGCCLWLVVRMVQEQ